MCFTIYFFNLMKTVYQFCISRARIALAAIAMYALGYVPLHGQDQIRLVADLDPGERGDPFDNAVTFFQHESNATKTFFISKYYSFSNYSDLWVSDGTSAGTSLLKRFSSITEIEVTSDLVYFSAYSEEHGHELWKSDGTTAGTVMVKDIYPGTGSSTPTELVNVNGVVYFSANNKVNGRELWKTNGTVSGTKLVTDIFPGILSGNPANLKSFDNKIFFKANDGVHGYELWSSNGTLAGTVLVKDILGGTGTSSAPDQFTVSGGALLFSATSDLVGRQLWKTDGTTAGTKMVKAITTGGSAEIDRMIDVNGVAFFAATDGVHGLELWRSDGTSAGTYMVKDITPGSGSAQTATVAHLEDFASVNGKLFFTAIAAGTVQQLWVSDGTESGTVALTTPAQINFQNVALSIKGLNNEAYFIGGGGNLYKTDGTTVTLVKVEATDTPERDVVFSSFRGKLHFISKTTLRRTDGTEAGTRSVKFLGMPNGIGVGGLMEAGGMLYFAASSDPGGIWKSDGTAEGTTPFTSFDYLYGMHSAGDRVFFTGRKLSPNDVTPWTTDGTEAGTINLTTDARYPEQFTAMNNAVYFIAWTGGLGQQIWKTDGTAAGTTRITNIVHANKQTAIDNITAVGNTLFFSASNANESNMDLWKTDGTPEGTVMVNAGQPGFYPGWVIYPQSFKGNLYYISSGGGYSFEPFRSDGTTAGTNMLIDLRTNDYQSLLTEVDISPMLTTDNHIFISGLSSASTVGLWANDGTATGTTKLRDFPTSILCAMLGSTGSSIYFMAKYPKYLELWKSDGTANGTKKVKTFNNMSSEVHIWGTVSGDVVYMQLTAKNHLHFESMWRSDGTEEGTYQLPFIGTANQFVPFEGKVYFHGASMQYGSELFVIEGTNSARSASARVPYTMPEDESVDSQVVSGYPNPFNSSISLRVDGQESETFMLEVLSTKGERVAAAALKCNTSHALGQDWKSGMYIFRIIKNNQVTTRKVMKLD